jgi:glycosyltransferase involved in cell wall biosynthesis
MIKKIDLFMPPTSQYGVLHHFTKKLCEALIRSGVTCRLLQAERNNPKPFLTEIFQDPPDCTLSFNGLLPDDEGRFFCDMIQIPHVACLVDSPNQFFSLIKSPFTIITCVDRFSCEFYRGMNFQNVLFMPHGVEKNLSVPHEGERTYDVVMLSSCIDYNAQRQEWAKKYSKELCDVMDEAAEITFADQETPYVQAFVQALDRHVNAGSGIDPQQIDFINILDDLETYIRGYDRVQLVKGIKDAKVDIFGSGDTAQGWKKYLGSGAKNVVLHDPVPYEHALTIMKDSKIILNSCPWIKNGTHERILAGLACGALVLTNENIFMREHFRDGESIAFYRHKQWDRVNEQINSYLNDESKRQAVAHKGREAVMKGHTWDHRAAALLKELPVLLKRIPKQSNVS